jgi:nucleotide-binding universal stress UspA family protein
MEMSFLRLSTRLGNFVNDELSVDAEESLHQGTRFDGIQMSVPNLSPPKELEASDQRAMSITFNRSIASTPARAATIPTSKRASPRPNWPTLPMRADRHNQPTQGDAIMYQSIVVPLDGSTAAEHALPWALSLAQQEGVALHLVRVHIPPAPVMVGAELAADMGMDSEIRSVESKYLEDLANRLTGITTIQVRHSLLDGTVADAIQSYAAGEKAGLIVMTTHGRGAFARFWLGSVADTVIRDSKVPTLLVRPNEEQAADLTVRPFIHRIIIPLDGSPLAERILEPAIKLGTAVGAEYALVLVLEGADNLEALGHKKVRLPEGWFPEATRTEAEMYLEKVARQIGGDSKVVRTAIIQRGPAAGAILEYAKTQSHPIIALATHGRSGIKRLLLGSVADKIVRGTTMPVLVYHPVDRP